MHDMPKGWRCTIFLNDSLQNVGLVFSSYFFPISQIFFPADKNNHKLQLEGTYIFHQSGLGFNFYLHGHRLLPSDAARVPELLPMLPLL